MTMLPPVFDVCLRLHSVAFLCDCYWLREKMGAKRWVHSDFVFKFGSINRYIHGLHGVASQKWVHFAVQG
jgi:hypothetical protein